MTKRRAAGTIQEAMLEALGVLTIPHAIAVTGISGPHLYRMADPDKSGPTVTVAVAIDKALMAEGAAPTLLRVYEQMLGEQPAGAAARLQRAAHEIAQARKDVESGRISADELDEIIRDLIRITAAASALSELAQDNREPARGRTEAPFPRLVQGGRRG